MEFDAKSQNLGSGYTELNFDNRDNIRDPEIRDVFQIRMGEEGFIPWPSDEFKKKSYLQFERQWNISSMFFYFLSKLSPVFFSFSINNLGLHDQMRKKYNF